MGIVQNADCRDGICFFGLANSIMRPHASVVTSRVCTVHIYNVFLAYNKCSITLW